MRKKVFFHDPEIAFFYSLSRGMMMSLVKAAEDGNVREKKSKETRIKMGKQTFA
jgi:hypothetical protein